MRYLFSLLLSLILGTSLVGCGSQEGESPCELRQKHCSEESTKSTEQCREDQQNAVENGCGTEFKELQRCEINACRGQVESTECVANVNDFDECMGL